MGRLLLKSTQKDKVSAGAEGRHYPVLVVRGTEDLKGKRQHRLCINSLLLNTVSQMNFKIIALF